MFDHFYHGTIRKIVVGFASLFNDIYMSRYDAAGNEIKRIRVPIAYGPKQKFIKRLDRIGDDFDKVSIWVETYLPRMSFEISNLQYDATRKLNSIQKTIAFNSQDKSKLLGRYERVPYNMNMNLGIMTKNTEECLQIMEQILPYFGPEYVFSINAIDGMDNNVDIPVVISNINMSDGEDGSYGDYGTRKITMASIQFITKFYLYGPVTKQPIISKTETNIFDTADFGLPRDTIKPYGDISVTAGDGITAGGYNPSPTAGFTGSTHADVEIREYPPIPWVS